MTTREQEILWATERVEAAISEALAVFEDQGLSARSADEMIRDAVFTAWWDWDYEPKVVAA